VSDDREKLIREKLIRENFEHERDFNYVEFRANHWNLSEVADACPDERQRERMLRGFWNQDAEERYPEYRAAAAGMSTWELELERENWIERLDCLGLMEYRGRLAETGRLAANDNDKGIDR
jgi:hypothetical protein